MLKAPPRHKASAKGQQDQDDGGDGRGDRQKKAHAREIAEPVVPDAHHEGVVVVAEGRDEIERHTDGNGDKQWLRRDSHGLRDRHGDRRKRHGRRDIIHERRHGESGEQHDCDKGHRVG